MNSKEVVFPERIVHRQTWQIQRRWKFQRILEQQSIEVMLSPPIVLWQTRWGGPDNGDDDEPKMTGVGCKMQRMV